MAFVCSSITQQRDRGKSKVLSEWSSRYEGHGCTSSQVGCGHLDHRRCNDKPLALRQSSCSRPIVPTALARMLSMRPMSDWVSDHFFVRRQAFHTATLFLGLLDNAALRRVKTPLPLFESPSSRCCTYIHACGRITELFCWRIYSKRPPMEAKHWLPVPS